MNAKIMADIKRRKRAKMLARKCSERKLAKQRVLAVAAGYNGWPPTPGSS